MIKSIVIEKNYSLFVAKLRYENCLEILTEMRTRLVWYELIEKKMGKIDGIAT